MLQVLAVTAPHWVAQGGANYSMSLNSREPYSLYNAIRYAAYQAEYQIGEWGGSNWRTFKGREESVMLYEYFEDQKQDFLDMLLLVRPNLIFIGTMTIGFAGAIEIAKLVKSYMGNNVFVVLGGKHIIETTYLTDKQIAVNSNCCLNLMLAGKIPPVFDLVVAGDGEEIVVEIGKLISVLPADQLIQAFYERCHELKIAKGNWLAGWLEKGKINYVTGNGGQLDQDNLPSPISLFGVKSNFPIFESDMTAHTYSYLSKGCPFNCFFCSEKNAINGKLLQRETAPLRLYKQFEELMIYGMKHRHAKISAFVEDSILLGGNVDLLLQFDRLLRDNPIDITFGGQFTADLLLQPKIQEALTSLVDKGLSYLFVGIETNNLEIASQMSKNTNKKADWVDRNELVLQFLTSVGIKCGFSVLFGLGEQQNERVALLEKIALWQQIYDNPRVISLNYATQHPLMDYNQVKHDYIAWGTAIESPLLPIFIELFGEASELYQLPNVHLGSLEDFDSIREIFMELNLMYQ